ncbi:MAG: hypothetical protein U0836_22410 [Pirellulales bacterium]
MDINHPPLDEPATADYVLSVLRDEHRQQGDDAPEPEAVLSFETTVGEWRDFCDLVGWRDLGRALNDLWGIRCLDAQWREVLEPAGQRCLRDVCNLIARHARRAKIRPATILGRNCAPAAAFLTVRSLLHEAGAPAADIAPSTPLGPYTRRYPRVFLGAISRLVPGALPRVSSRHPVYNAGVFLTVVGTLLFFVGTAGMSLAQRGPIIDAWSVLTFFSVLAVGILSTASGMSLTWFAATFLLPAEVRFGEFQTFRDLAESLAAFDSQAREM